MRPHSRALLPVTMLIGCWLSLACSTVRVTTDFDPDVDFTRYQSFAWLDPPMRETPKTETKQGADPLLVNTLVDQRVRSAVESALILRGYRRVDDPKQADFQLRYSFYTQEVLQDDPVYISGGYGWGRYPYYGTGIVYGGGTSSYQRGTLILDVISPETQRITWRGWAPSKTKDGYIDEERIVRTVDAIVEEFPPTRGLAAYPEE